MSINELLESGITFEGQIKIQSWEKGDYPTIYFEGTELNSNKDFMNREIDTIFPYEESGSAGICIELSI